MVALCFNLSWAQNLAGAYPTRPITIVLPYATGASSDIETRLYIPRLIEGLGQPVIVDYKPGAGASTGTIYVSKAASDGYTILYVTAALTVYPAFFSADKIPYDPVRDFAPVSLITRRSTLLLVHPSLGVRTFPEYIAYAKSNPGKINFGTSGGGGILHIVGAWLHSVTNTHVTFIHYKGAGDIFNALMSGEIHTTLGAMTVNLPLVKAGKARSLGISSLERNPVVPDMVPLRDQGAKGFEYDAWSGIVAPKAVPMPIIRKLNAEASYFVAQDGLRCALIFFDMKESSELPAIAEPLFKGLNAEIEVIPAMNADDLKKGLGAPKSA